MRFLVRPLKALVLLIVLLVLAVFVPVVPVDSKALGDPSSHTDPRVQTDLSDEDLRQILRIVRRGHLNSVFEIVWYQTRRPLLRISKSEPTWLLRPGSGETERQEAKGQVVAEVGVVCGRLCGSGVTYYLEAVGGTWRVVEIN